MIDTEKELAKEIHQRTREFEEHGQQWASCLDCGAQWSVVDCEANGEEFEDWEEVSEGDGYCEGVA